MILRVSCPGLVEVIGFEGLKFMKELLNIKDDDATLSSLTKELIIKDKNVKK